MNLIINLYKAQKPSKYKILKAFEKKTLFQQTKPLGIAQRKFQFKESFFVEEHDLSIIEMYMNRQYLIHYSFRIGA